MIDRPALDQAVRQETGLMLWAKNRHLNGEPFSQWEIARSERDRIVERYHRIVAQRAGMEG